MPLNVKLDNIADLDPSIKALYTEKDGVYMLDIADPENVAETSGLVKALKAERQLHKNVESKLKPWQSLGKTPEEITSALQAIEQQENEKLQGEGKLEEILLKHQQKFKEQQQALKAGHQQEVDSLNTILSQKQDMLNSQIRNTKLQSELAKAGVMAGYEDLAINELSSNVRLDDNANVVVFDKDGDPSALSITQFIAEYSKKRPALFVGSMANGSGSYGKGSTLAPNTIKRGDNEGFLKNLPDIIAGKVKVID